MERGEGLDRLRILVPQLYYLPHRTGVPLHIQRVAEELVRRGHAVTVLTARYKPDLAPEDEINGVKIVRLRAMLRMSRGMIMPAYPLAVTRLIQEHDVIWFGTPQLETALVAFLAERLGKRVVVTHHGDLVLPRGMFNAAITRIMYALYYYMAERAGAITAYSDDYADHSYYLMPFRDRVTAIYPPVTIPRPNPARVAQLRAQWSLDGGPLIGYAGRFVEEKRPDLLIQALDTINDRYPNARIVFAGEYDIKYEETWQRQQALVNRYRDQLLFLGLLTDMQAMADFYAACDVLVLPSGTECFGLVQVEAMLCGTPVVMTNIPGARVVVQATGMGKIVPPGDARLIGEAVLDVLHHRDAYQRPREEIEKIFSFEDTVNRYERCLRANARPRTRA